MNLFVILGFVVCFLHPIITVSGHLYGLPLYDTPIGPDLRCQERLPILPPGRACRKPCERDNDCVSRRKRCLCDGACGKSCIKTDQACEDLPSIPYGVLEIRPYNKFGAIARYTCKDGYERDGDEYRTCQGDERWSGNEPKCLKIGKVVHCSSPPEIKNAYHDEDPTKTQFNDTDIVKYKCKKGYMLPPHETDTIAFCVNIGDTGKWLTPKMNCVKADCKRLVDIQNGFIEQKARSNVGDVATFRCKPGYVLAGRQVLRCEENGRWSSFSPPCVTEYCTTPPEVEHARHDGYVDQKYYPVGSQVIYMCMPGYQRDGNNMLHCSGDGLWRGTSVVSCNPVECPYPGGIPHGKLSGETFTYRSKVSYECEPGYELIGQALLECLQDGSWSSMKPECHPPRCDPIYAPDFGFVDRHDNTLGSVIRFRCVSGYRLEGSQERRCQADRTWSGVAPTCVAITCELPVFYNGYLKYLNPNTTSPPVGTRLEFHCQVGTKFEGVSFVAKCMETGQWSAPTPVCWGMCKKPFVPNAVTLFPHRPTYLHKTVVHYTCDSRHEPRGKYECYNGTWTQAACAPASCKERPPQVYNGMRVYLGSKHGDKAKYRCFAGFRLEKMETEYTDYLTCQYGKWVGGKPRCVEYFCPSPTKTGKIQNGRVYKKVSGGQFVFKHYIRTIRHGDRLIYECDRGYRLEGPSGATCVHGRWQPPINKGDTRCVRAIHPPFRSLWHAGSTLVTV